MSQVVTHRLTTAEAIAHHLAGLVRRDARLAKVVARAGPIDVRMTEPGFAGMAKVICGQQLSVASARAIWTRFATIAGATDPARVLLLPEETIRASGFSAGKTRTLRAVAEAVAAGELDFDQIDRLPADEAIARLTTIKGIGPWTAEIYLMFCAGHPDVFPSGDLALQKAVAHALGLEARLPAADLATIAADWSPHRAAAALLFWRYFAAIRAREGIAL